MKSAPTCIGGPRLASTCTFQTNVKQGTCECTRHLRTACCSYAIRHQQIHMRGFSSPRVKPFTMIIQTTPLLLSSTTWPMTKNELASRKQDTRAIGKTTHGR